MSQSEANALGPESESPALDIPAEIDHRSLTKHTHQRSYSEEEKALALSIFAETGSIETAARDANIPRSTVHSWITRDPDIDAKVEGMRQALRQHLAHRYAVITIRAADALLDRVENGNYHVDKEGNISRRPMPGNELAYVMSVAGDKHALLTGTMQKQTDKDQELTTLAGKLVKALEARSRSARAVAVPHESPPASPA